MVTLSGKYFTYGLYIKSVNTSQNKSGPAVYSALRFLKITRESGFVYNGAVIY